MWRDEFLARERVAERNLRIADDARLRALLRGEPRPRTLRSGAVPARRVLARLMASAARAASAAARRLDPEVRVRA